MQIPILAGRDFQESDRPGSPAVAVINEVFAKNQFRRSKSARAAPDSAGSRVRSNRIARDMEIVGVSANARYGGLKRDIPPVVYIPYDQGYPQPDQMMYTLRTSGDPLQYVNTVREIVRQADARVPVSKVRTQAARHRPDHQPGDHVCQALQRLRHPGAGDRLRRPLRHRFIQRRPPHR